MAEKPLAGRTIVVTRAPDQARELTETLESLGAEVLSLPTVEFAPPEDWARLDAALRELSGFDAILFLSKNAVRYVFARCRELGIKWEAVGSQKCLLAAVGPGTARELEAEGLRVNYTAKQQSGQALVRELGQSIAGRRVLLPRSDRGDERLGRALREAGARVTEIVAYRTTAPQSLDPAILDRMERGKVDILVFASPSAFHNLRALVSEKQLAAISSRLQFAAIGPTTARALRDSGIRVEMEAAESSPAGLADSISKFYLRRQAAARPA